MGALSASVAALQQPPAGGQQPRRVDVDKLRDNLFVVRGGGGNSAVFVTGTGVVVVDSKNPDWGQTLIDAIKTVTDKPVTMIINTHGHGDHSSGNVEFPANIEVVAHANTPDIMRKQIRAAGLPPLNPPRNVFEEKSGRNVPTRTFTDRLTLGSGNDRIELRYFGRGHTSGDAWVLFPAARVLHAGDMFSGKNLPLIDSNNGGSAVEIATSMEKAAAAYSDVQGIITGHSTVMTAADLKQYAQFNREFLTAAQQAKRSGRALDEFVKTWTMPASYTGYAPADMNRLRVNAQIAYDETR